MKEYSDARKDKARLGIINFLVMVHDITYDEAEDIVGELQTKINDCDTIGDCMKLVEDYLSISGEFVWIFM